MAMGKHDQSGIYCGIEYEYLLCRREAPWPPLEYHQLDFAALSHLLENKPGRCDPSLATGDLGVKSGYWYLEGDERFDEEGNFVTMAVKGVEIRTPPKPGVESAIAALLVIEKELSSVLASNGMALGIAGFHPLTPHYDFAPPLNRWELAQRLQHRGYDAAHVSTLSYGPDINLSFAGWSQEQVLAATRRLIGWSPYIVPFSFSSPYFQGKPWRGPSIRTYQRSNLRPAAKCFWNAAESECRVPCYPARFASEQGRIEFKAFDAIASVALLEACCYLLIGLCLAEEHALGGDRADGELLAQAAQSGFADPRIHAGAAMALGLAEQALVRYGYPQTVLAPLRVLLDSHQTPADLLLGHYRQGKPPFLVGGLALHPQLLPVTASTTLAEIAAWESLYGAVC